MKYRPDFVTNSSSASFILYFKTSARVQEADAVKVIKSIDENLTTLRKLATEYASTEFTSGCQIREVLAEANFRIFKLTDGVSMYNGEEDRPEYIKELIRRMATGESDWKFIDFEVIDEG